MRHRLARNTFPQTNQMRQRKSRRKIMGQAKLIPHLKYCACHPWKQHRFTFSQYTPQKFAILEALSATGLRSIRYAKEIPLVKSDVQPLSRVIRNLNPTCVLRYVIANDLSATAAEAMRRNVELNGLGPEKNQGSPAEETTSTEEARPKSRKADLGKVRVNEGDAW